MTVDVGGEYESIGCVFERSFEEEQESEFFLISLYRLCVIVRKSLEWSERINGDLIVWWEFEGR